MKTLTALLLALLFALGAILSAAFGASGPTLAAPKAPPDEQQKKNRLIDLWKKEAASLKSLEVQFEVTRFTSVWRKKTVQKGSLQWVRGKDGQISVRLEFCSPEGQKPEGAFVFVGKYVYILHYEKRLVGKLDLERSNECWLRDLLIAMVEPYRILQNEDPWNHFQWECQTEDQWYDYLKLKLASGDFVAGRITVDKGKGKKLPHGMIRQIWLQEASGDELTYDVTACRVNSPELTAKGVRNLEPMSGWEMVKVPSLTELLRRRR